MKSKCSFILKASTALVLALLMLFGTVATSVAAVVDEYADTGAQADVADEGAAVDMADEGADVELSDTGAGSLSTLPAGMHVYFKLSTSKWNNPSTVYAYFFTTTSYSSTSGNYTRVTSTKNNDSMFSATVPNDGKTYKSVQFRSSNSVTGGNYTKVHTPDYVWNNTVWDDNSGNWNDFTTWGSYSTKKTNSQGKIYFDNSTTQWTGNIYLVVARATDSWYFRADKMTADADAPDIYYYSMSSTFSDGYTAIGFANSGNSTISSGSDGSTFYNNASNKTTWISDYAINNSNSTYVGTPTTSGSNIGYSMDYRSGGYDYFDSTYTLYSGANGSAKIDGYQFSSHGSATANTQATASASGNTTMTIAKSSTVTVTPVPNTGYNVKSVTLDSTTGTSLTNAGNGTYTYKADGSAHSIYVEYEPKTYTISYNAGANGTGTVASTTKTHGTNATLSSSTFSRTGYTQDGWSTTDGGAKAYNLGATNYSTEGDATLYPHWAINTYAITLSETGGSGTLKVDDSAYTGPITHGSHTFRVDAPDGMVISSISGIAGGWTNNGTYATLGSTSITSAQTITVTYASAGTPSLQAIANQSKTVNNTSFNVTTTIDDEDKKSGTLTVTAAVKDSSTNVITVGTATISNTTTVTIPVTVVAPGTKTVTVTLQDNGSTISTQEFDITVADPTFTVSGVTINASTSNQALTVANGGTAPSSIAWSSSHASVTVNASGQVSAAATSGGATITATATYACGYQKTTTATVTLSTATLSISATTPSAVVGNTTGASISATNPTTAGIASYSWQSNSTNVAVSAGAATNSPTFRFDHAGQATITLTVTYENTGLTKSATMTLTANAPTVSFATGTAQALLVNGTYTDTATGNAGSSAATRQISYSGTNSYINVNASTGEVTALKPTASAQTVTATYHVVSGSQTTDVTATYTVTVTTPTVTFANFSLAKGDSKDLSGSATTSNPSGLTIAYSVSPAVTGVSIAGTTVSVADDCAASSATIVASAKNSAGTEVATASATLSIEDPSLTITDTANASTKYLTVGTNYSKALTNNFGGAYNVASSNTSVATVSVTNGTLTVVPVAKGTATITVTAQKGSTAAMSPSYLMSKLEIAATGADVTGELIGTGISATQTFTVSVADTEETFILFHENDTSGDGNWGSAYIYLEYSDGSTATSLTAMTYLGKDEYGHKVWGYKISTEKYAVVSKVVFCKDSSWPNYDDSNAWKQTKDYVVSGSNPMKHGFYKNGQDSSVHYKYNVGTFDTTITVPQVMISDATTPLGTNYTLNATKVNDVTVGKYKWTSGTTGIATVTADTGTTANTTVVPVDAGTTVVTVKAYAAQPTGWTNWQNAEIVAGTDTATITVTADDKTLTYGNKLSLDGSSYSTTNASAAGTVTATKKNTSTTYSSGSSVPHGTDLVFSATANPNYKLVGWDTDGDGTIDVTTATAEIHVSANTTVYAHFDKYYTTAITVGSNGTVKKNNANFTGEDVVWNNTPSTIVVTPSTGYMIDYDNCTNLSKFYTVDTSATTGAVTIAGKTVAAGDKANTTITIAFKKLSYTVTGITQYQDDDTGFKAGDNTNATGGTIAISNNGGGNTYEYGDTITITATPNRYPDDITLFDPETKYYMVTEIEYSTDGGTTWSHVTCNNESPTYTTSSIYNNTFVINNASASSYIFRASFKGVYFLTIYDSWMEGTNSTWQFVASPPRRVEVGTGGTKRTYTYAAGSDSQRGEDNTPVAASVAEATHHIVDVTGSYYEGNKLLVYAGEQIKLTYSGLASSDAIRGAYFNNERRYTTETEDDNLFYKRAYRDGGYGKGTTENPYIFSPTSVMPSGEVPDDDWDYDYEVDTTLYAFEYYYTGEAASTIHDNEDDYIAEIDQTDHTITWTATQNYFNIDLELDYKYQVKINEFTGYNDVLVISNMNDEGFYYNGEAFDKSSGGTDGRFKISLDNSLDTTGTYTFTDIQGSFVDASGNSIPQPTDVAVVGKKSDGTNAASAAEVSYFVVEGNMPNSNLYIELPVEKTFKLQLANIIVADTSLHRTMLTETDSNSTSDTDCAGIITATVKNASGQKIDATGVVIDPEDEEPPAQMDISTDGTNYFTYNTGSAGNAGSTNNTDSYVYTYDSDPFGSNRYLNGGVNVTGASLPDGYTVTYTYTARDNELGPCYSFLGWYEGTYDSTNYKFTVDYTKKLSSKPSFTYTPKKNTVVIGVGTRDMYLGGTFKNNGDYTETSGEQTWTGNRIKMDYDPVEKYYYHTFDSVDGSKAYHLRCYDTVSGTKDGNLIAWSNWSGGAYNREYGGTGDNEPLDTDSVNLGRYYESDSKSEAYFCMASGWKSIGYDAPVTVKFKASTGDFEAESTYQWSQAYVSAGRGIDVLRVYKKTVNDNGTNKEITATDYNVPTVVVKNKTVNNKDVTVSHQPSKYGATTTDYGVSTSHYEYIDECTVKENDGQIIVAAYPNDEHVDLQAVLVYDIDSKRASAVKTIAYSGADTEDYDGDNDTSEPVYVTHVTIPHNTKVYVVPIYKFTDDYIDDADLETHTVYVRADELDKDDWGGLVAMYSWGTAGGYDSGGWPGQLMIPSDDGESFYAPLTFMKNGLAGVTFDNYNVIWGGQNINFIGTYKDHDVSTTQYCSSPDSYIHQNYDFREPISIINNINVDTNNDHISDVYLNEDMDLTFALKMGDMNGAPTINSAGSGESSRVTDWSAVGYLTDRSGKNRVDLNGNTVGNSTETYRIVAYYTNKYGSGSTYNYNSTSGSGASYNGSYSINWTVYDAAGTKILDGATDDTLSASYTDVVPDSDSYAGGGFITYIAKKLFDAGEPVNGKAVKIAYENPGTWSEAVRYAGQWYADGVNTIINGKVRIGTISDGDYLPMNNNKLGNDTATVAITDMISGTEDVVGEFEVANKSLARTTKSHATNGYVTFTATNEYDTFVGWYIEKVDDDGNVTYVPATADYKNLSITPSFNDDITYYAFYRAAAIYNFHYTGRNGVSKTFTMSGRDLSQKELDDGGYLDKTDPIRIADLNEKLSKVSDISVFNYNTGFTVTPASFDATTRYQLNFTANNTQVQYMLTVYGYNSEGALEQKTSITNTWSTAVSLDLSYVSNKPSGQSSDKFVGWIDYNYDKTFNYSDVSTYPTILSTQANFGYSITQPMSIKPFFAPANQVEVIRSNDGSTWQAGIDKNVITQELTSANTGRIYNDTLVNFRNKQATGEEYDLSSNDCGLLIICQTGDSTNNADYSAGFDTLAANSSKVQGFVRTMAGRSNNSESVDYASAKLGAAHGCGDAYAFRVKATLLSDLNRAQLFMGVDYHDFSGGKYLVVAYTKIGDSYTYSDIITGNLTPGQTFPALS